MHILLLYPPQAKQCEPPAGLPLLAASLRSQNIATSCYDLNVEAFHFLMGQETKEEDTWSKRAAKNRFRHIETLRDNQVYSRPDSYKRATADLNRFLENLGRPFDVQLSLANYQDAKLSPLKSKDLLECADNVQANIFRAFFSQRLAQLVELHAPTHIGISLNYLSQALPTFALLGLLKRDYPGIRIILGGGLVTTWMQGKSWHNPFTDLVDHMVAGPGETSIVHLLSGTHPHPQKRQRPDYSDFTDYNYLAPGLILPYATSTGCFWRKCAFCPETSEENPYRPVAPDTAVTEVAKLSAIHHPTLIHFLDNAISPAMLHQLVKSPPGVPWYGFVRFTEELANPEFCLKLKASGCAMLKLGLESGSQQVLDSMHKGIDLVLASQTLNALHQANIATYVYLLFGTRAETHEEALKTLNFVKDHHRTITFLNLAVFNLPLESPETQELEIAPFSDGDLSIYSDFIHPLGWNRKEVRRFLDTEFKKDIDIRKILANDPPHFTSNHAPLFHRL